MLAESRTRDRKVVTGAVQNKFLLQSELSVLTLIRCPFHPVLPQWHEKDPGHSAKKCRWQVTPKRSYTLDSAKPERADDAAVQA